MYCNILAKKMILSLKALGRGAVFQHDNDPKNSAEATSAFLKKKRVKVLDWPSMSPDLNPIKHVWNHPKRQVEMRQPSNLHELKDVVATEWRNIQVSCSNLVHSMQRRLAAVIKNNGSHTKY